MRKLLAIALLSLFGLTVAAPMLSWAAPESTRLPACCRRGGAHHCAQTMSPSAGDHLAIAEDRAPQFTTVVPRCPFSPATVTAMHGKLTGSPASILTVAAPASHPTGVVQTECRRRIARDRARLLRGPPAPALAV